MTKVMILATDGFEQSELMKPKENLENAGIETTIVSLEVGEIKGWDQKDWGKSVKVDMTVADAKADDFDALLLPGGQMNPDILRMNEDAIELIKDFDSAGKPIAAICHAPWLLVEVDVGAPHADAVVSCDADELKNPEHPLRQRAFDYVIGLHPDKGGLFRVEDQLAIWFPTAKVLLV